MSKLKVYYNSACPVCDAGIRNQREKMAACSQPVEWIDIHHHGERLEEIGANQEFVRERLHVVDEAGRLRIGADAFATLYARTPGQRWRSKLLAAPIVRFFSRALYNRFAAALYRWNRSRGRW